MPPPPQLPPPTNGATHTQTTHPQQHANSPSAPQTQPIIERPYSSSTSPGPSHSHSPSSSSPESPQPPEDPSSFEWRNLKKLIVLVLSSLTWKLPLVQNQIRLHGGVDTILNCTQYDGNNPYIKEHAVMCLKFLLEGNKENQDLVRGLEAQTVRDWEGRSERVQVGGLEVGVEGGRVRVRGNQRVGAGVGGGVRRASEGSAPVGYQDALRERYPGLSVRPGGRVLGEECR